MQIIEFGYFKKSRIVGLGFVGWGVFIGSCLLEESKRYLSKDDVQIVHQSFRFSLWEFPDNGTGEGEETASKDNDGSREYC